MNKSLFIIGSSRSGKTTLSRMIHKELGYSIICLDEIISAFGQVFPDLGIIHDAGDAPAAKNLAPFLTAYLHHTADGPNYHNGCRYVIEGTHIDFDRLIHNIDREKYLLIGLTYNHVEREALYKAIKEHDTEDDWTYWCGDEELRGNVDYFIERNIFFDRKFREYGIPSFDVSGDRTAALNGIVAKIKEGAL